MQINVKFCVQSSSCRGRGLGEFWTVRCFATHLVMFEVVTTVNIKVWCRLRCDAVLFGGCVLKVSRRSIRLCRQRWQVPLPASVPFYQVTRRHIWVARNFFFLYPRFVCEWARVQVSARWPSVRDRFVLVSDTPPPGHVLTSTSFSSHPQTSFSLDTCRARPMHFNKVKIKMVPRILDPCPGGYWRMVGFSCRFGLAASGVVLGIICRIGA